MKSFMLFFSFVFSSYLMGMGEVTDLLLDKVSCPHTILPGTQEIPIKLVYKHPLKNKEERRNNERFLSYLGRIIEDDNFVVSNAKTLESKAFLVSDVEGKISSHDFRCPLYIKVPSETISNIWDILIPLVAKGAMPLSQVIDPPRIFLKRLLEYVEKETPSKREKFYNDVFNRKMNPHIQILFQEGVVSSKQGIFYYLNKKKKSADPKDLPLLLSDFLKNHIKFCPDLSREITPWLIRIGQNHPQYQEKIIENLSFLTSLSPLPYDRYPEWMREKIVSSFWDYLTAHHPRGVFVTKNWGRLISPSYILHHYDDLDDQKKNNLLDSIEKEFWSKKEKFPFSKDEMKIFFPPERIKLIDELIQKKKGKKEISLYEYFILLRYYKNVNISTQLKMIEQQLKKKHETSPCCI